MSYLMTYLKIINLKTISVNLGPGSDHLKCELNLISYKSTQDSQRRHWGGGCGPPRVTPSTLMKVKVKVNVDLYSASS